MRSRKSGVKKQIAKLDVNVKLISNQVGMNVFTFKVCVVVKQISESISESSYMLVTVTITEYTMNPLELYLAS